MHTAQPYGRMQQQWRVLLRVSGIKGPEESSKHVKVRCAGSLTYDKRETTVRDNTAQVLTMVLLHKDRQICDCKIYNKHYVINYIQEFIQKQVACFAFRI
jgi:hypothetical protein